MKNWHLTSMTRRKAVRIIGGSSLLSAISSPIKVLGEIFESTNVKNIGRKKIFFAYRSFWPEFEAMKQFKEAGVNTVCIFAANTDNSLGMPYSKYPPVWHWFGKYDFSSLNKQYDDVLAVNPDADFICMIDLNSPIWLERQLQTESESFNMLSCACANPEWLKETTEYLVAVVTHMEKRYGNRIAAYVLASGHTDEWMDYSRQVAGRNKTNAWKQWLKKHGKDDSNIPSFERIDKFSFNNMIRDPESEQDIIDYVHFTGDIIVDAVLKFVKTVRKIIPEERQIGMFFGYILELAQSRLVSCGHLEYERLFSSPDIDLFISPSTYSDREMGGGSGFMVPNGTRVKDGKNFLHEIDHRTPTYNTDLDDFVSIKWMVPWKDQAETTAGLKREFSLAIINSTSTWCFDMWGGVFSTSETMKVVAKSKKIWDKYVLKEYKSLAEVALIADPQSTRYLNDGNADIGQIYRGMRNKLNRLGAPFEVFSFNDLSQINLDQYKLILFPGLFEVTSEREDILRKYVFNNNRSVIFVSATAVSNGKNLNTERVKKITGTSFNTPGINKVQHNGWVSIYAQNYEDITPKILKLVAAEAEVTIYCRDEVPVYANEHLFAVHMANGGDKTITLPVLAKSVKELYTEQIFSVKKKKFNYHFSSPDTALFEFIF